MREGNRKIRAGMGAASDEASSWVRFLGNRGAPNGLARYAKGSDARYWHSRNLSQTLHW